MADTRRFTWAEGLLFLVILIAAAGVRAGYLISCADYARNDGPLRVEMPMSDLDMLVRSLKSDWRFAVQIPSHEDKQDTAWTAPGYYYTMAAVGHLVDDPVLPSTMRWFQCGLGTLTAGLYFLFARRAFRSSLVAVFSGVLCAVHPFWILDTATLTDGVTATFLLALALFLGGRATQTSGPLSSLLYGLTLAALALVRAAMLPFAFVALAWFLLRSRTLARGWLAALLAFLGFVNGLAPWTIRNWQLFGEPLPIVESTYYHLWIGNKPPESKDSQEDMGGVTHMSRSEAWPTIDGCYANEIQREMYDRPAETLHRRLLAGLNFFVGERWFKERRLADSTGSDEIAPTWLARSYPVVLEGTLLGIVVLGLLGWRWTYGWRASAMPSSLAMIWIPLPYVLSHAEALSGPRLPLDGVLLCYAAFALACLLPGSTHLWADERANAEEDTVSRAT
jgi:4-amino-4-deoxy-L-arabinose transferase-like glycosyltransferase